MLQDMQQAIEMQKQVWLMNQLKSRHNGVDFSDKANFERVFTKEGYRVQQNGMQFILFCKQEVVDRFKPIIDFSAQG